MSVSVADLAAAASEYVERAVGVEVDYTPETLPLVDHYVTIARGQIADRPPLLELVARALGAYFGEVMRRHLGGFWHVPSDDAHEWLLCLEHVLLAVNPVGVAYDVLFRGQSHDGPTAELLLAREEREAVRQRLAALPEVDEGEYYMLATRLEVIEIAVAALLGDRDTGTADVTFDREDYRVLIAASRN